MEKPRPEGTAGVQRAAMRPALGLEETLELLVQRGLLDEAQGKEVAGRATTLRSSVLKERVGSVRSQAAARYDVSPAELVAAARFPHPDAKQGKIDENSVAKVLAAAAGAPYLKIDPLKVDNDLVAKTLSRPFAHRHVVIPIARERDAIAIAVTDPFDTALRDSLEQLIQAPLRYVVAAKCDIIAIIDRVYGFRSKVTQAPAQRGRGATGGALVQLVELRSNAELAATSNDEHVVAAVDYLLNYAFEQRASDLHLAPRAKDAVIRFPIDGILRDIRTLPLSVHGAVVSRIKVLAGMNIA